MAGLATNITPTAVLPCVAGNERGTGRSETLVGEDASSRAGFNLRRPIEEGVIDDWDDMEKIWHHVFHHELKVDPQDHFLLFSEPSIENKRVRERMTEIVFETFNAPAFRVAKQALLSMYASNRQAGIMVECGEDITNVVWISQGMTLGYASSSSKLGGRHVTEHFRSLLSRHWGSSGSSDLEVVRDIKEKLGYVAMGPQHIARQPERSASYELPDGNSITIGNERFLGPEILFYPRRYGFFGHGIPDTIFSTIKKCDLDMRERLCGEICVSGATTLFPGFVERLDREFRAIIKAPDVEVAITAVPERKFATFIGGVKQAATLPDRMWVTKQQYEESGSQIIRVCY